jgi:hypothetical protein
VTSYFDPYYIAVTVSALAKMFNVTKFWNRYVIVYAIVMKNDIYLYILGVTLSASHQSETWDPEAKATYPRSTKLLIRQALLGPDAKPDELNVVQVVHIIYVSWQGVIRFTC